MDMQQFWKLIEDARRQVPDRVAARESRHLRPCPTVGMRRVNALVVFKTVRNSLSGSAATWAFSNPAHHVTQDHPVYIPGRSQPRTRLMAFRPSAFSGVANPEKEDYSAAPSPRFRPGRRTA